MTHCSFSAKPVVIKWQEEQEQEASICFICEIKCHLYLCGCCVSVLIVPLHNRVLSFPAGLWPGLPTPALVHWCRASKQRRAAVFLHGATVGQSPRGGVFSNKPCAKSGFWTELRLCHFLLVNVSMSALWLHGFLFLDTARGFHQHSDSGAPKSQLWLQHPPTSLFFQLGATYFGVSCEAWNMGFCVGIWQMPNLRRLPDCTH